MTVKTLYDYYENAAEILEMVEFSKHYVWFISQ